MPPCRRQELQGTTTYPIVVPRPPSPLVLTKDPGDDDDLLVVVLSPLPSHSPPPSVLPHCPHLLLFPFGSDVVVVALDGRCRDVALFGTSSTGVVGG